MIELIGYWVVFPIMAILVTKWLVRRAKTRIYKGLVLITCFVGFWELFWLHDTLAQWELNRICEKEGGIRVYKTVELPPEYFAPDGSPKFVMDGQFDVRTFGGRYRETVEYQEDIPGQFSKIHRVKHILFDDSVNQVLGTLTFFEGQVVGPPRPVEATRMCPSDPKVNDLRYFISAVFKISTTK